MEELLPPALSVCTVVLSFCDGLMLSAISAPEQPAKLNTNDKKALEKLAEFRESIGDYRAQAEYLEKLYELDKRNAATVRKLAAAYEQLRNKPAALEFYNKYLDLGKGNSDYEKIQKKVEKLSNTEMQEEEGLIDKIMRWFNKN